MIAFRLGLCCLAAIGLSACQAPPAERARGAVALPPMAEPTFEVGYEWAGLRNGEVYLATLTARSEDNEIIVDSEGCTWHRPQDMFSPSLSWWGCELAANGSQKVRGWGRAWPISVGKTWSYTYTGYGPAGTMWRGSRDCAVEASETIDTRLGLQDVYRVVCVDPDNVRRWFVSPALGAMVRFEWEKTKAGRLYVYEMTGSSRGS